VTGELRVETVRGPLDEDRLGWVSSLYGRVDAKYRSREYLRHLLVENPFGWSLHAFVLDGERPVGHCCVVPMRARRRGEELVAGKVEAFFVEEEDRARSVGEDEVLVAVAVLRDLYDFAERSGIEVLHAFATPDLGVLHRMLGFRGVAVGSPSFVRLVRPDAGAAASALAAAQRLVGAAARLAAPTRRSLRPLAEGDAALGEAEAPGDAWTISGRDAWAWYATSGLLAVLEVRGAQALVRTADGSAEGFRVLSWRASRGGLLPAVRVLGAAASVARSQRAAALRFQPWLGEVGDGRLTRAARLLGFVRRSDFSTLYVRSRDPELARAENVALTPFFYTTF
jgi:hypothetical protein